MERRKKVKDQDGNVVNGTVVDVAESTERFGQVKLEDGTIIRARLTVIEAIRLDNSWDSNGNPTYIVQSQNIVTVVDSPESLKRKVQ